MNSKKNDTLELAFYVLPRKYGDYFLFFCFIFECPKLHTWTRLVSVHHPVRKSRFLSPLQGSRTKFFVQQTYTQCTVNLQQLIFFPNVSKHTNFFIDHSFTNSRGKMFGSKEKRNAATEDNVCTGENFLRSPISYRFSYF